MKLCWWGLSVEEEDVLDKIILEFTPGDHIQQFVPSLISSGLDCTFKALNIFTFRVKTHLKWIFSFMKEEKYVMADTGAWVNNYT